MSNIPDDLVINFELFAIDDNESKETTEAATPIRLTPPEKKAVLKSSSSSKLQLHHPGEFVFRVFSWNILGDTMKGAPEFRQVFVNEALSSSLAEVFFLQEPKLVEIRVNSRYAPLIDEVPYRSFGNRDHSCILIDSSSFADIKEINLHLYTALLSKDVKNANDIVERSCVVSALHIKSWQNWLFISWHADRRGLLNRNFFKFIQILQDSEDFRTYNILIGGDFNENLYETDYLGAVVPLVNAFPARRPTPIDFITGFKRFGSVQNVQYIDLFAKKMEEGKWSFNDNDGGQQHEIFIKDQMDRIRRHSLFSEMSKIMDHDPVMAEVHQIVKHITFNLRKL